MTIQYAEELLEHLRHKIEIATYTRRPWNPSKPFEDVVSVTIECIDCNLVLFEPEWRDDESKTS